MITIKLLATGERFTLPIVNRDDLRANYVEIKGSLPIEGWDFVREVIEYSINEGGEMSREVKHDCAEDADVFPEFSYQSN